MTMRSLRGRLGALVAAGALGLTLVAATAVAIQRWDADRADLVNGVEFAAFQHSETRTRVARAVAVPGGTDEFVVLFDDAAQIIDVSGDVPDRLIEALVDEVWTETTQQDVAVTTVLPIDGATVVAAGVPCVDQDVCDTVVVGAVEEPLGAYLGDRLLWLVVPALLAAAGAWAATHWLVGRSLRPVDHMRRQLETIAAGDLERRIPVPDTGDEIEDLGVALNDTIGRLAGALAANERFVADAAHELRSPITGVRAALELQSAEPSPELIDAGLAELDRAARLIDDLLLLARRQAGALDRRDIDLDDLVVRECDSVRARFPDVAVEHHVQAARIVGDPDALGRVVRNLVENACRYGNGQVAVRLDVDGDRAVLHIDDDGPGIPPEDRSIVFERFTRLDGSRSRATGGTGLGLAIVAELVNAHGGTVAITDGPLGGARVELTLPRS